MKGKDGLYDACEVAEFVIDYSNEMGYPISAFKVESLLYFVQAYFLLGGERETDSNLCFRDRIEARDWGPVIRSVHDRYGHCGSMSLYENRGYAVMNGSLWDSRWIRPSGTAHLEAADAALVRRIVDCFSEYAPGSLQKLVRSQDPWMMAYRKGTGSEITPDSIAEWFR